MTERDHVLKALRQHGVLGAIGWAHASTYAQTWQDFNPAGGHGQGWLGYTAYTYMVDRQNRVFKCERFAPESEDADDVGRDVLADGIGDFDTMPNVRPGLVTRANLNGSPGWTFGGWRWLLVSYPFGQLDYIHWPGKSLTKKTVAQQPAAEEENVLFGLEELGLAPMEELAERERLLRNTLVLAHAMDHDTGIAELYLGRPRWNPDHGAAWQWRANLLKGTPGGGFATQPMLGNSTQPELEQAPDVLLRLRRQESSTDETKQPGA